MTSLQKIPFAVKSNVIYSDFIRKSVCYGENILYKSP